MHNPVYIAKDKSLGGDSEHKDLAATLSTTVTENKADFPKNIPS